MIKLNIKATNFKLEPTIYDYIQDKIGNLDRFIEKVDSVVQGWVEVGLTTKHHQSGNIYRAEVQIRLPGKSARSEATAKDIFLAIDAVKDELQEELKKYRERQESLHRRGTRVLKKIFHLSPFARFFRKGRIKEEGI
jgi:ribosomal subunit interface protein